MNVRTLVKHLMSEPSWYAQGYRVCWLAARYYLGKERRHDLELFATRENGNWLTEKQVQMIIDSR